MPTAKRAPPIDPRTRLNLALARHVAFDFEKNGAMLIAKIREGKPLEYLKLVSTILNEEDAADATGSPLYTVVERHIIRPENQDG